MKKPLTLENKKDLLKILMNQFSDELDLEKSEEKLVSLLDELFINFINKQFGDKLLKCFKNTRDCIRNDFRINLTVSYLMKSINPDFTKELIQKSFDPKYRLGNLQDDSPETKLKVASISIPEKILRLMPNHPCPSLTQLNKIAGKEIFYKNNSNIPIDFDSLVPNNRIDELWTLLEDYLTKSFIYNNAFREFKYNDMGSTVFKPREFLWNIKTWEELEELNKEWYDTLVEHVKISNQDNKKFDISTMSIEEIFNELDDELGL